MDGTEIALRPKALALLRHLVEHPGRLIDRDELLRAVWPNVFVTDDSITQCVKEVRRALALAPNSAPVLLTGGWLRAYVADSEAAISYLERVKRLSPVDLAIFYFNTALSLAHFAGGRYAEAAEWARQVVRDRPSYLAGHRLLATSLARLGRRDEAAEVVRALLAVAPGFTVSKATMHLAYRDTPVRELFLDGLRQAGLPE